MQRQGISGSSRTRVKISVVSYIRRKKEFPKLPKSRAEVQDEVNQVDIKTNRDEPFVLHNDHEAEIVIFSCSRNLQCLCNEAVNNGVSCDIFVAQSTFCKCTIFMDYTVGITFL